jgi:hypothetical protein
VELRCGFRVSGGSRRGGVLEVVSVELGGNWPG